MQNPPSLAESRALDIACRILASNAVNRSRRGIRIDQSVNATNRADARGGFHSRFNISGLRDSVEHNPAISVFVPSKLSAVRLIRGTGLPKHRKRKSHKSVPQYDAACLSF